MEKTHVAHIILELYKTYPSGIRLSPCPCSAIVTHKHGQNDICTYMISAWINNSINTYMHSMHTDLLAASGAHRHILSGAICTCHKCINMLPIEYVI